MSGELIAPRFAELSEHLNLPTYGTARYPTAQGLQDGNDAFDHLWGKGGAAPPSGFDAKRKIHVRLLAAMNH